VHRSGVSAVFILAAAYGAAAFAENGVRAHEIVIGQVGFADRHRGRVRAADARRGAGLFRARQTARAASTAGKSS